MKYLKNTKILLLLIILVAVLLRLPLLNNFPPGITIDEAGQGYSAYSILKTGKDEWGDFLPLNPRGFGDYKPPVNMYLLVPSVAIFGLNEFAVRFPSAAAGILTVLIIFFLVRELFKQKNLGLFASFLMAISPWHVYYSRLGWESNIGLMFFCVGIWLFLKGLEKNKWFLFSILGFGLSALSYHSFKVLAPLMIAGLSLIFLKQIRKLDKKILFSSISVMILFVLILGYGFIFSGAGRRASDQSLLKEENLSLLRERQYEDKLPQPFNRVFNNKYIFLASRISDNYLGYFSLPFLFGPHRSGGSVLNFPTQGLLFIWQLPLLFLGIFYLIKNRSSASAVIFLWLFISPVPASLTQDYMHAGRAQVMFPALTIISAVGFIYALSLFKNLKYKSLFIYCTAVVICVSVFLRIDNYLFHTFNKPHGGLVQGYAEIINFAEKNKNKYDKIIFTKSNSEPQTFIAFYTKWDPRSFQNTSKNWVGFEKQGFRFLDMTDYNLEKYEFKRVDLSRDRNEKNALIIGTSEEIPPSIIPLFSVKDSTGKTIFIAVESDEI